MKNEGEIRTKGRRRNSVRRAGAPVRRRNWRRARGRFPQPDEKKGEEGGVDGDGFRGRRGRPWTRQNHPTALTVYTIDTGTTIYPSLFLRLKKYTRREGEGELGYSPKKYFNTITLQRHISLF